MPFEKTILLFIEYKTQPHKRTWQQMKGDVLISVLSSSPQKIHGEKIKEKALLDEERRKKLSEITTMIDAHGQRIQLQQKK